MIRLSAAVVTAALIAIGAGTASARPSGSLCVGGAPGCFATLQAALSAANDGDTIRIAAGTFAGGVTVSKSVTLAGAGAGATVINGGGPVLTIGVAGAATEPTVSISGVTMSGGVTVGNLTPSDGRGGGIYIPRAAGPSTGATVTITNSVVRGNRVAPATTRDSGDPCPGGVDCAFASAGGGGISNDGNLTLDHVQVVDNVADAAGGLTSDADGGGILNRAFGNLTLRNSTVTGNVARVTAPNGRFADGGGILAVAGTLTIEDSVISGNNATVTTALPGFVETSAHAAGVHSQSGVTASIHDTVLSGNTASETNSLGPATAFCGAICTDGSADLRDDSIDGNHVVAQSPVGDASGDSAGYGVGCCDGPPIVAVTDTRVTNNTVVATGAGFVIASGGGLSTANTPPVVLQDDVINGNRLTATSSGGPAVIHGAGVLNAAALVLRDTRVSDNAGTASGSSGEALGGGIWNDRFDPSQPPPLLSLFDSVVTRNALTGSAGVSVSGGGVFTVAPVARHDSTISHNAPDDCAGC